MAWPDQKYIKLNLKSLANNSLPGVTNYLNFS